MKNYALLKQLWLTFSNGDHLETSEIKMLIRSAKKGAEYLRVRGEYLALSKTLQDLNILESYLSARGKIKRENNG